MTLKLLKLDDETRRSRLLERFFLKSSLGAWSSKNLALWGLVSNILNAIGSILLARALGPFDRGLFGRYTILALTLSQIFLFGRNLSAIDNDKIDFYRSSAVGQSIVLVALASVAQLAFPISNNRDEPILAISIAVCASAITIFNVQQASSKHQLLPSVLPQFFYSLTLLVGFAVVALGDNRLQLSIQVFALASLIGCMLSFTNNSLSKLRNIDAFESLTTFTESSSTGVSCIMSFMLVFGDRIVASTLLPPKEAGIFLVASSVAGFVTLLSSGGLSKIYGSFRTKNFVEGMTDIRKWTTVSCVIGFIIICLSPLVAYVYFGSLSKSVTISTVALSLGFVIRQVSKYLEEALKGAGVYNQQYKVYSISLIMLVAMSVIAFYTASSSIYAALVAIQALATLYLTITRFKAIKAK
jgi:O-antigen/teichoic acid export membrane protein